MTHADAMSRIGRPAHWRAAYSALTTAVPRSARTTARRSWPLARSKNPAPSERGRGYQDGISASAADSN